MDIYSAAVLVKMSPYLLDWLTTHSPKKGEQKKLLYEHSGDEKIFKESDLKEYARYFLDAGNAIAGEGSVSYMYNSEITAPQLKLLFPDVKLIFMLRNPIERYYSDPFPWRQGVCVVSKKATFLNPL